MLLEKMREIDKSGVEVVCLQEVKRRGIGDADFEFDGKRWSVYWHGLENKGEQGVAIAFKRSGRIRFIDIQHYSARVINADIEICGMKIDS